MLKLVGYLHTLALYPAARVIVAAQSAQTWAKTLGKQPKVHHEAAYDGRPILLLALYEKGRLRPDVIRLLRAARAEGLYVLAVNTLRLKDPGASRDLIDCYIERPNFGRDFGSYKTGFLHVLDRGWQQTCPRLLMINDSIFFSAERMPAFLRDMMASDVEVLGSTENFEIEYHLGSFCIAMAQPILQHPQFQAFWRGYRLTDVRPLVIKRGEMGLSKVLKRCASSPQAFAALYGARRYLMALNEDDALIDIAITRARTSDLTNWKRVRPESIRVALQERFFAPVNTLSRQVEKHDIQLDATLEDLNRRAFVKDRETLLAYLRKNLDDSTQADEGILMEAIRSELGHAFIEGSQIHQNAAILLHMGMPLVKLDGLYRGMFNLFDIRNITAPLQPGEQEELTALLVERPYGNDTLIGWRKAAFNRGLI
ncbi:rhamnan synthesis F family protein [Rhodobacter sp. Har01]|uniref:rhamnan synthesis F family protein n=1 Tax=Rhodobacter sp. Har01 TaxID=2883999 RepID=UPI001D0671C8|nr:rhamnan synthesis F family protein [Rhodobacter sp. Har01]MCB6178378.1 rhamnan synthesis F family protein [Rhodobacter sp. Har01]